MTKESLSSSSQPKNPEPKAPAMGAYHTDLTHSYQYNMPAKSYTNDIGNLTEMIFDVEAGAGGYRYLNQSPAFLFMIVWQKSVEL